MTSEIEMLTHPSTPLFAKILLVSMSCKANTSVFLLFVGETLRVMLYIVVVVKKYFLNFKLKELVCVVVGLKF